MEKREEIKAFHHLIGIKNERKKIGCVEIFFFSGPRFIFLLDWGKIREKIAINMNLQKYYHYATVHH